MSEKSRGNPWLSRMPIAFAHQGGAREAPSNTLYAMKRAVALGVDALEFDLHATRDGEIVVRHDHTLDRTTSGRGNIDAFTLEDIKKLDAAYWWSPGMVDCHLPESQCDHLFRGVATAEVAPPDGFAAGDFQVPTLREVLETFAGRVFLNMEIKRTAPETRPYEERVAQLLGEFGRGDDVIVASFRHPAMEAFDRFAEKLCPEVSRSATPEQALAFRAGGEIPGPPVHALQVPSVYQGQAVIDRGLVEEANRREFAVHVWTIDQPDEMAMLFDFGVQGVMTDVPTTLLEVLRTGARD